MKSRIYISIIFLLGFAASLSAQNNELYRIERLPLSSNLYNDMSPVLTKDGIFFCSDRNLSAFTDVREFNGEHIYNIYFAPKKDTMAWDKPVLFGGDLSMVHEGPFCFTPDGSQIYFTSNIRTGKDAMKRGISNNKGIFIADKEGDSWTNIRPFEHNDPLWNVGHPFISNDGKYLFFAADIPGGEGGSDIWYCENIRGRWTIPFNLGSEVNSPESDLYPFFSPDGELYFASDRAGGHGGLDIYASSLRFGQWKQARILPEPLNSTADDFSYFSEPGSSDGYFSSNRGRNDDIYLANSLINRELDCDSLVIDEYCYEFFEKNATKFDSLPFLFEWDFGDGQTGSGVRVVHCFEGPGEYQVKLFSIDTVQGYKRKLEKTRIHRIESSIQAFIDSPDTCNIGEPVTFDAASTNLPGWDITEYYWNFDDGTFSTGITVAKTFMEPGTYIVQLIVRGSSGEDGNTGKRCVSKYIYVRRKP
ncbi:MAG: PKD domain-containing protein [Marinilabiliaceae bacterium]|jgi:hypothetical protein|nr:PKD domain-containing protein [Marinilabiliaceae bacterium]